MLEVIEIHSPADLDRAMDIRRRVFVDEQHVPLDLEIDAHESDSRHFLALEDGTPVGTARARPTTIGQKIERVAVLASRRGRGIGAAIVNGVLAELRVTRSADTVYVYAQVAALGFWERQGFVAEGPCFDEAGIVHRMMRLRSPRAR